ncbi:unnamed protein product [Pleuronectes platessa]|uniref:Uncharacterized protein n=1 Tax=Pleuronectes platessa TaxID=8262 RepID=A0A9N7VU96_PLEPL|nr:unnamed protein product [Pleuronectes platessa]
MGDFVEDEALMSHDWQPSGGQPSAAAYTSYNSPSALWKPISVATQQTVPSAPAAESFVNSESRDWSLNNPNSPLMFPLSYKPSNPAGPQPGPNTDSSTQGGGSQYVPHLVYEEVFQYPSGNEKQSPSDGVSNTAGGPSQAGYMSTGSSSEYSSEPSYQRYPSNAGAQQVSSSATGSSAPAQMSYQQQNPVASPKEEAPVRVSEPILPRPPPPPSYIIQYKNGFVRVSYLLNKSRYSPGLAPPPAVRPAPARRQAPAPVGVRNPQRKLIQG